MPTLGVWPATPESVARFLRPAHAPVTIRQVGTDSGRQGEELDRPDHGICGCTHRGRGASLDGGNRASERPTW